MSFIIKDWAGNILFNGKRFKTFEDAWGFIYEKDPCPDEEQEAHWFDDYYVEQL